jgi:hypothetical protein
MLMTIVRWLTGEDGMSYRSRNRTLARMGYRNYRAYLRSNLWQLVRNRVIAAKGRKCRVCRRPGYEIHHTRYAEADLKGMCLDYMHPICTKCHRLIEYDRHGRKRTLAEANSAFRRLRTV